jgi:RNA polymerase sigma-19 factor, ECF subfamily
VPHRGTPDSLVQRIASQLGSDLLRFLARRVRNKSDARDIAHEAYVRLLRLDRKDLIRDPQPYVYRLATHLIHEFELKRRADDARLVRWTEEQALTAEAALPQADIDAPVLRARIHEALEALSPTCRAVVVLHRRDGLTYEEIAAHLGISVGMVKKHLAVGLRHCRSQLRDLV